MLDLSLDNIVKKLKFFVLFVIIGTSMVLGFRKSRSLTVL